MSSPFVGQVIDLLAALMLLIAFAMLAQRRLLRLIHLFALQGAVLTLNTMVVAVTLVQSHLWFSVALNLVLKVIVLPMILIRVVNRLGLRRDAESVGNLPFIMLVAVVLVILSFNVALPISRLAGTITRGTLGIAMASMLIAFLMMITRRKAVAQVVGFLAMENALFFAATSATYGMPMVVELGIALDVLVGTFIFGIFFFQIRETFDSLDTRSLERLGGRE